MSVLAKLALIFVIVPLIELALLIQIGQVVGFLPTMGLVVITGMTIFFQWFQPRCVDPILIDPWKNLQQLFIPALIIGSRFSAVVMRMTRSSLLEVLREDYIRTAWSKGLSEKVVIFRHALKNCFIPVITIVGQQFSILIGGTVIVEFAFLLPGLGSMTLDAVMLRDYTVIQGTVLFFATVMVLMNLLVDLTYSWFDPRIRYQ